MVDAGSRVHYWATMGVTVTLQELVLARDSPLSPYLDHRQLNAMYARYKARK